ncbi:hypothetical protein MP228_002351 [Amoeboaphelidium protococcarum]|nr:hypothetical protein MP228_002351 [Amoeboaphelidium protococcarum]
MNKKKSQQQQQQVSQSNGGKQGVSETFLSPPVEEALHEILRDWPQLVPSIEQIERNETDYNPITLALELLDTTNPASKSPDMFLQSLGKLEHAMEVLVDEYYTPFNASIQTYSQVSQMVGSSLTSATTIKSDLVKCITLLSERRNDRMNQELLSVWTKSVKVKEMLKMFTQIDELVQTPAKIQTLMADSEYVQAAKLLLSSLKKLGVGQSQTSGLNEVQGLKQLTDNLLVLRKELPSQILNHLVEIMFGHGDYYQQNLFSSGRQFSIENSGGYGIDGDIHHPGKENDNFIPGHIHHNRDKSNSVQGKGGGKVSTIASNTRNDGNKDVFHLVSMCVQALDLFDKVNESAAEIKSRLSNEMFKVTEAVIKQFESNFGQTKGQLKQFKKKTANLVLNEVFNLKKKDPLWTLLKGEDEQQRKLLLLLFSQLFERYRWIYQMNQYVVNCLKDSYMSESTEKMYYLQVTDGRKSPVKDKVLRLSAVDSWNAIQTELKDILELYLDIQFHQIQDKPLPIAKPQQGASGNASNGAGQKSIFQIATESITGVTQSAKSASSPLKSKPEDMQLRLQSTYIPVAPNTSETQRHKLLVDGSIANILTLYKPCVDFAASMEANFLNRFERRSEIFSFLNTALGTQFIEYMNKMVVEGRYNSGVTVDDAFDIDSESDDYYLVQRCFPSMSALLYDVYVVQHRMLMFADKLQAIVDKCMNQFISSCSVYFEQTASRINSGLSSEYASSKIAIDVLHLDQVTAAYRQVFIGSNDGGNSDALTNLGNHDKLELTIDEMHSIKQRFIEQRFGEEFAFINVDYSSVESIANLYVSLRWFTRSIECIPVRLSNLPPQTASPSVHR